LISGYNNRRPKRRRSVISLEQRLIMRRQRPEFLLDLTERAVDQQMTRRVASPKSTEERDTVPGHNLKYG
jgi:hypothetical protein